MVVNDDSCAVKFPITKAGLQSKTICSRLKFYLCKRFTAMKDLMGRAIWDYYHNDNPEDLQTETSISELDDLPVSYLFRDYQEMNALEKKALDLSFGKVLDVGSGAGSHSLYLQNERKLEVTALDISPKSIEICKARGVENAVCEDFLKFSNASNLSS